MPKTWARALNSVRVSSGLKAENCNGLCRFELQNQHEHFAYSKLY